MRLACKPNFAKRAVYARSTAAQRRCAAGCTQVALRLRRALACSAHKPGMFAVSLAALAVPRSDGALYAAGAVDGAIALLDRDLQLLKRLNACEFKSGPKVPGGPEPAPVVLRSLAFSAGGVRLAAGVEAEGEPGSETLFELAVGSGSATLLGVGALMLLQGAAGSAEREADSSRTSL